jgi:hypothetical protein
MLTMYGGSDDLVELEGIVVDEISMFGDGVVVTVGDPETGGVLVKWRYAQGPGSTWSAEINMFDEGVPVPWMVSVKHRIKREEVGYSVVVSIDCPKGTPVSWAARNDDGEEVE